MALFKKKVQEEEQPEFYMSAINTPAYNYAVYNLSKKETIICFLLAFAVIFIPKFIFDKEPWIIFFYPINFYTI